MQHECGTEHCGGTKARGGVRDVLGMAGHHQNTPEHARTGALRAVQNTLRVELYDKVSASRAAVPAVLSAIPS